MTHDEHDEHEGESPSPTPQATETGHAGAQESEGRRTFLKVGVGALGAGLAGIVAVPALRYTLWPLAEGVEISSGGEDFIIVGKRAEFGTEPVKVFIYADRIDAWNKTKNVKIGSAWVVEREGQLVAYSTVCPHLGCAVDYSAEDSKFKCPCHRSAFALDGKPEEGPAPRALDELELSHDEDAGGLISIRYERFKQGTEDKVKV